MAPRRPPPSPLLLATGPTPPRGAPKHVMPAPPPRSQTTVRATSFSSARPSLGIITAPALAHAGASAPGSRSSSPVSRSSASRAPSPYGGAGVSRSLAHGADVHVGPWDIGRKLGVSLEMSGFDVGNVLEPPKRAAVSPIW